MGVQGLMFCPRALLPQPPNSVRPRGVNSVFFSLLALFVWVVDARLNQAGCGIAEPMGRILGGDPLWERKQLPWIVELQVFVRDRDVVCGGSIITRDVVLTAAHCVIKPDSSQYNAQRVVVYYNTTEHLRGPTVHARSMLAHAKYTPLKLYDLALLKLERPLKFDAFVKPICLPLTKIPVKNRKLLVAGWGVPHDDFWLSNTLQYTELDGLNDTFCANFIRGATFQTKNLEIGPAICTLNYGKGTCVGDSGGPVSLRGARGNSIQVGVVSAGTACKKGERIVKIFPEVYGYMRWIKKGLNHPKAWRPLRTGKKDNRT